jgi:hypothetical protein
LLAVAGACGRIHFGELGDGGSGDGVASGDGAADAAIPCSPFDQTYGASSLGVLGLEWTGGGYAIFTLDGLATVSSSGVLGTFRPVVPAPTVSLGQNAIAWNGSELAVVWGTGTGAVDLQLFDASIAVIGSTQTITPSIGDQPRVIWADDRFAVAWGVTTQELAIEEISITGAGMGAYTTSSGGTITQVTSIVSTDGHYLVGYYTNNMSPNVIAFDRPLTGAATMPSLGLGMNPSDYLQLATVPSGVVAAQAQPGVGAGDAQLLGTDGSPAGSAISLPTDGVQTMSFVTVVPYGANALAAGITAASPDQIVTAVFDTATQTFEPLVHVVAQSATGYGPVAAVRAPGRVLLAIPYADNGGATSHTRLVQLCE